VPALTSRRPWLLYMLFAYRPSNTWTGIIIVIAERCGVYDFVRKGAEARALKTAVANLPTPCETTPHELTPSPSYRR